MTMHSVKKYKWFIILCISYLLVRFISKQTNFIDTIYYDKIYRFISPELRKLTGFTSISIGDCLYLLLLLICIYKFLFIKKIWLNNKWKVINMVCISLTVFILFFNFLWGFNYYRTPLHERLNIASTYSEDDLKTVTQSLINRLNKIHLSYVTNKDTCIEVETSTDEVYKQVSTGYEVLSALYPEFNYKNQSIKSSLFSLPLTYMGFSGYINPFTNEAQINNKVTKMTLFVTASHEVAHQIGIGPESEANFVGYLAAKNNPNKYFEYAATSFALRYCLNRYPFENKTEFETYLAQINPGIIADWKKSRIFWEEHQTFIDTVFKFIYDKFLKVNQQEFGVEGYSMFLDLLIHYELNEKRMN